jgi:hypothetical protein
MTSHGSHPTEEDLILHFYGESNRPAVIHAHLALCPNCRAEYEALVHTLAMVATPAAPERGDLYGLEVWQRIRPRLPFRDPWSRLLHLRWSTLTVGAAVAVFTLAAFIAGRYWPATDQRMPDPTAAAAGTASDERARTMAIIDHLDRSERVLLDVSNTDGSDLDVAAEQGWAADLIDANRLYRDAALQAGETTTASVLDDLERTLLDIVHAPSKLTPGELDDVRARLDAAALLFKVRVLSNELRERETALPAPRKTT